MGGRVSSGTPGEAFAVKCGVSVQCTEHGSCAFPIRTPHPRAVEKNVMSGTACLRLMLSRQPHRALIFVKRGASGAQRNDRPDPCGVVSHG